MRNAHTALVNNSEFNIKVRLLELTFCGYCYCFPSSVTKHNNDEAKMRYQAIKPYHKNHRTRVSFSSCFRKRHFTLKNKISAHITPKIFQLRSEGKLKFGKTSITVVPKLSNTLTAPALGNTDLLLVQTNYRKPQRIFFSPPLGLWFLYITFFCLNFDNRCHSSLQQLAEKKEAEGICVFMHVCICMPMRVCACTCAQILSAFCSMCVRVGMRMCIHACMQIYVHACLCVCTYMCLRK